MTLNAEDLQRLADTVSEMGENDWHAGRIPREEEPDTCVIGADGLLFARVVGSPDRPAEPRALGIAALKNAAWPGWD